MRRFLTLVLSVILLAPAWAQDAGEHPWRESVTGQIEALRSADAIAALSYAGAAFRTNYTDPERFMADVNRSGYGPIATSRSHSFGAFRELSTGAVVQEVELVGTDGKVWEAIYQMTEEPDQGWRVQGVVLRSTNGLGI